MAQHNNVEVLSQSLMAQDNPIGVRMRAIFLLRSVPEDNQNDALDGLCNALRVKGDSVLLRHEIAYVLGQMGSKRVIETLSFILRDVDDDPIVRHECAEAIAAINDEESYELLKEFCNDERPEVHETCRIAVDRMDWARNNRLAEGELTPEEKHAYESVDPAPAKSGDVDVEELLRCLMDTQVPLFERYRAMFSLRNLNTDESILALTKGLHDSSALFRHEVAYVLGQVAHPVSVPALSESLCDKEEHGMVRHEAAEALGAIATEECIVLLKEYLNDPVDVVRESCEAALDTVEYWNEFEGGATKEVEQGERDGAQVGQDPAATKDTEEATEEAPAAEVVG